MTQKLEPYKKTFIREVTRDDIIRLLEIKMQRILKFNKDKADELIQKIKAEIAEIDKDLSEMVRVTIEWFTHLKEKYGSDHPRRTEIKSFDTIVAAKVVDANEKLYIDRQEGFIGTGLKKAEFVQNCSDLDDVISSTVMVSIRLSELPTRCLWVRVYFTYRCLRRTISVRFITSFIVTERRDLTISNASM